MAKTTSEEPALPEGYVRDASGRPVEVYYLNDQSGIARCWERYWGLVEGVAPTPAPPQLVFWVCESDGVHQGWLTTFSRSGARPLDFAVMVEPGVGGNPFESDCRCEASPAEGWGGVIPGEIHGQESGRPV